MELEDLRLGNTVLSNGEEKDVSAYTLFMSDGFPAKLEPIELTDEKMVEWGFVMVDEGPFHRDWRKDNVMIRYKKDSDKYIISTWTNSDYDCAIIWIDWLHDLQNIYYTIMRKPLEKKQQ